MLKKAMLLKKAMIQRSSKAESVTAEPEQEGGIETADNASVVAPGVAEVGYIVYRLNQTSLSNLPSA